MTGTLQKALPPLPLEEWADTTNTLHRFARIVGKIRVGSAPHMNHWCTCHCASSRGDRSRARCGTGT